MSLSIDRKARSVSSCSSMADLEYVLTILNVENNPSPEALFTAIVTTIAKTQIKIEIPACKGNRNHVTIL